MSDGSQYQEATFILEHFAGRTGRFLDIGAFDGKTFSNTWQLAQLGWSGVCVEPNPPAFCHLMQAYDGNDRVELVNAAVIAPNPDIPMLREFHCNTLDGYSADMMSTFDQAHKAKWTEHPFRSIWIPTLDWADILGQFGVNFHFINIDVEGLNAEVLADMPIRPELLCVEMDPAEEVTALVSRRYRHTKVIGGNLLAWGAL
jgi:FkbM family methyltransferase